MISFIIHPEDISPELAAAPLGTNYAIALVEITPGETPAEQPEVEKTEGEKAVQMAGILCGEEEFQNWLTFNPKFGGCPNGSIIPVAELVRTYCGVSSRAELATNPEARAKWIDLTRDYRAHQSYGDLKVGP